MGRREAEGGGKRPLPVAARSGGRRVLEAWSDQGLNRPTSALSVNGRTCKAACAQGQPRAAAGNGLASAPPGGCGVQWCAMRCSAAGTALPAKHPVRSTPLSCRPKSWGRQTSPSLLAAALLLLTASQDRSLREGSALPLGHAHAMRPAGRTAGLLALLLGLACLAGRAAAMGREC